MFRDAQAFVNTIRNCISSSIGTVEWRSSTPGRANATVRNSDPSHSAQKPLHQQGIASSRSCHILLPSDNCHPVDLPSPRSPSPVWKRRTTPVRKQPMSMNIRQKTMRNSTDC